ncbi:SAV_2336 N-terminal domain-related protein [Streptomyces sp. V4I2]|uniref:SAV_2336 N-terminal domain-related protein n=1 Tax=Streptomyces sp. V4I2 TaxID=3042280 RepID=UPI0027823AC6|nr:SAV_2336 N-terminal domain-related protein [Streptomyces sp. V4I2]MDQ1045255.1 beta-phosphoglucomutase-like phosphatase (HAD superfamily) [Streptomyces sp. V4I2]
MASERAGSSTGSDDASASPVARLSAVLAAAAEADGPTPRELAELLWLAGQLERTEEGAAASAGREPRTASPAPDAPVAVPPRPEADRPRPPDQAPAPHHDARVPLLLPTPAPRVPGPNSGGGTRFLAPAPPMLHRPLALQRALRPLKRKVPSPRARVLDERATADRIARLGAHPAVWVPVLRPAPDRWLRLNLVHDTGPTMPVWRPLVRELHTVLAQSGIFRTVTLHPAGPDGRARQVPALDDGRTVTLVVSDCMGPQWRPGETGARWYGTLRHWAARMPVAVVQPLPEHLWAGTALPAEPGLLTPPAAAAPSAALTFLPYDPETPPPPATAVPLPVLEPGAPWLANWAALLADPGGSRMPGAAAWLPVVPRPPAEQAPDIAELGPEDLVLRFRATASPEAFRLAGHLALAVPSVPVMRLVQRTVDRDPRPQHLAEVILSGMLQAVPGPAGRYEFRPGVRDLLLRSLPRTARGRTREFLAQVGGLIDERAGLAAGEFRAETGGASGGAGSVFATVSEETVRRLGGGGAERLVGGRYRIVGERGPGQRMWEAVDVRTEERVVVHLYPEQAERYRERFLREAAALAEVDSPYVVRVLDFGVDGEKPYLVAEFVDGVTVREVTEEGGHPLSFTMFARLARQGGAGLAALHARGLVRGQRGLLGLLLRPEGAVLICRFALGEESLDKNPDADYREFDRMLQDLARRVPKAPPEHRGLLDRIAGGDLSEPTRIAVEEFANVEPTESGRFTLLGELRISHQDSPVASPSPDVQTLLCMLLLRHGRRLTYAELAQGMWDDPPAPGEAARIIDDLAAQVWRLVDPCTLVILSGGYALHAADHHIDVDLLEKLSHRDPDQSPDLRRTQLRQALDLFYGDPLDGVPGPAARAARTRLRALRDELTRELAELEDRTTVTRRSAILFEADDLSGLPEARISLEYAVHEFLSRGTLAPHQHEVRVRDNGYAVLADPDAYLLPLLVAVLRGLPEAFARLADPPRLQVTFWDRPGLPPELESLQDRTPSDLQVVVPPALYEEFAASSAALGTQRFQPLYGSTAPDTPPLAWYCPLAPSQPRTDDRDLVHGPLITHDLHSLGIPAPGRTAIVHTQPEGPLTLLNPARPHGSGPPRATTYYEVDLTTQQAFHQVSLPSSGKGAFHAAVELFWRVEDPVAFVHGEVPRVSEVLLEHLLTAAGRITRRHPLRRAGAAQRSVNSGLRTSSWPVPGLSVSFSVHLVPEGAPLPVPGRAVPARRPLSDVLGEAETVLLGFDGPVTRLYSAQTAREAALDLLSVVAEHRDPEDALAGRHPLPTADGPGREVFVHPLDVLRAFAHDRLGPTLRRRLDEIELRAVPDAPTTHNSVALVRALHTADRRVLVVTDVCEQAVHRYLEPYRLPLAGVHGRSDDLSLLMPHPDCLLRALRSPDVPAPTGVLIGSTVAELTAAQQVGLRFIGLARNPTVDQSLREAGCEITVPSLAPVLEAARSL